MTTVNTFSPIRLNNISYRIIGNGDLQILVIVQKLTMTN